ncbi:hypothetical protein CBM2637_A170005 [Cupriavidus taiwanensis]|nr:hypothetical protein CBM2637_A170005 [Cupriavidus taiwanensis]
MECGSSALEAHGGMPKDIRRDFSSLGGQAESQCGLAHGRNAIGGLRFAQAASGALGGSGGAGYTLFNIIYIMRNVACSS